MTTPVTYGGPPMMGIGPVPFQNYSTRDPSGRQTVPSPAVMAPVPNVPRGSAQFSQGQPVMLGSSVSSNGLNVHPTKSEAMSPLLANHIVGRHSEQRLQQLPQSLGYVDPTTAMSRVGRLGDKYYLGPQHFAPVMGMGLPIGKMGLVPPTKPMKMDGSNQQGSERRPETIKPADMSGWLYKQKHAMVKTSDKRWFELFGTELRYYENQQGNVPARIINVQGASVEDGQTTALRIQFVLKTPKDELASEYNLAGENFEEVQRWKDMIKAAASQEPNRNSVTAPAKTNLVALVNSKSGGKQGASLIAKIKKHLGENNVVDIKNGGPKAALTAHKDELHNTRFLVCGGDGTVGWALQDLDKIKEQGILKEDPTFAVLPLGTGNDMARTLHSGGGYSGEKLLPILSNATVAGTQKMDRWKVAIKTKDGSGAESVKNFLMCNYFSIGYDAKVAYGFHCKRETKPELFRNRAINKLWYAYYGLGNVAGLFDVSKGLKVTVDGKECSIPSAVRAIAVINIPSYSGGANLWGKEAPAAPFKRPATDDGMLEVVGTYSPIHSLGIMMGVRRAERIGQGKDIVVSANVQGGPDSNKGIHCQVDGEPYFVDHAGFHDDVRYLEKQQKGSTPVQLSVEISHHAVATLVAPDPKPGCCSA